MCSSGYSAMDPTRDMLGQYLKMGPATSLKLNIHGRSSDKIDKILIDIYRNNGFQPFWITNGKPSQRAKDIFAVLRDADKHGLNPSRYLVNNISQFWKSDDTASLVRLDIVLTLGMVRYVADQREGGLDPRQIDPELFATARDVEVDWKAVFQTAFKTQDIKTFLVNQAPPFLQYKLLQKKLAEYRMIVSAGGWPSVPAGEVLKPGKAGSRVKSLRRRLAITGELIVKNTESTVFDQHLMDAVKKFQTRHNLSPDGIIGGRTLLALNVPVESRIQQIIINMERYRWLKRQNNVQMVAVNIAAFEVIAGRPGKFDISMPVIVGKNYHETPVFNDTIKYVVFNPYWNLTPSIARNETLPRLKDDPNYLQKQNMRIFQGWQSDAVELDPATIDWSTVSEKQMDQYHVRQDPGPNNALGTLKLIFPNKYNVYLHDTPSHNLFKRDKRALSHGCIRMARPAEMAAWVLGGEKKGWSVQRVNDIVATGKRQVVTLDQPMPIFILYRTASVLEDGELYFYNDIYGRDKLFMQSL
jgi:murein L,D-transpeptidase YcbB/YkuD